MLILTRSPGKKVIIGDDIEVKILGILGNQVRINIDAPQNVSVHREEIYERILNEKLDLDKMGRWQMLIILNIGIKGVEKIKGVGDKC